MRPLLKASSNEICIEQVGRCRYVSSKATRTCAIVWHTSNRGKWFVQECTDDLVRGWVEVQTFPEMWRTEIEAIGYAYQIVRNAAGERLNPKEPV